MQSNRTAQPGTPALRLIDGDQTTMWRLEAEVMRDAAIASYQAAMHLPPESKTRGYLEDAAHDWADFARLRGVDCQLAQPRHAHLRLVHG